MPIKETLNANPVTLGDVFSNGRRYVVPAFQRDYAWTHSEWSELWDDIIRLLETDDGSEHFLGAIVLQRTDGSERSIVDGQQRLVTLTILALAVIHRIEALAIRGRDVEANETRVRLLRERFVSTQSATSLQHHPRLKLNDSDNPFYATYLVQGRTRRGLSGSARRLASALAFFDEELAGYFGQDADGAALAALLDDVVAPRLRFIEILVDNDETAFTVFETLNARGVALGTADLLKNYLFRLASKGGRADLDQTYLLWQQIVDRVPLDQLSAMLFHQLAARVPKLSEKRVFSAVKARVPAQVNVFDFLRSMHETAEIHAALDDPLSSMWHEYPDARSAVRDLKILRMTHARPLILAAIPVFDAHPERLAKLLRRIIAIGVRTWIARLHPQDIQRAYHAVALRVTRGECKSPRAMAAALGAIHVNDEQFRTAFTQLALDPKGPRKRALRYVFSALEAQASGRPIDFDAGEATIEHILPVNPAEQWTDFSAEAQKRDLTRLGNLTPLEYTLNRALGAKAFEVKREAYADSAFAMTQRVAAYAVWTPETLRRHQEWMADLAVKVWSLGDASTAAN